MKSESEIRFISPEEAEENKTKDLLKENRGIFFEKHINEETGENENKVNILGVDLETYASKEEIDEIKKDILMTKLDKFMLKTIAECYKLKQPLLFEGDPGSGKTYLVKKFIELIHGENAPSLEIVGTPKTTELDILGHWAPKGLKDEDKEKYQEFLQKQMSSTEMDEINNEFNKQLEILNKQFESELIDSVKFQDEFGKLSTDYINKQKQIMQRAAEESKFSKDGEWEFKEGALLKAYAGNDGRGYPLIVDEFNIIPSNYQQIFLQISGKNAGMSDSISFWGNTGKTVYKRGKDAWICFASNFPEKTPGRSEVVAPMSDRLVWQVIPDGDYQEKKRALKRTAGGRLARRKAEIFESDEGEIEVPVENGIEWDAVLDEKLGEQIADVVDILDEEFVDYYQQVGDSIPFGMAERRRTQKLEFSGRNPLRLFSYLDHFQVRNEKTGEIDFTETLRNAYEMYYVGRLASVKGREKMQKLFDQVMTGDTGKVEINLDNSHDYVEAFKEINKNTYDLIEEDRKEFENEKKEKLNFNNAIEENGKNKEYQKFFLKNPKIANNFGVLTKNEVYKQKLNWYFGEIDRYIVSKESEIKKAIQEIIRRNSLKGSAVKRKEILDYYASLINRQLDLDTFAKMDYIPYKNNLENKLPKLEPFDEPIYAVYDEVMAKSLGVVLDRQTPFYFLVAQLENNEKRSGDDEDQDFRKALEFKVGGNGTDVSYLRAKANGESEDPRKARVFYSLESLHKDSSYFFTLFERLDSIEKYLEFDNLNPVLFIGSKHNELLNNKEFNSGDNEYAIKVLKEMTIDNRYESYANRLLHIIEDWPKYRNKLETISAQKNVIYSELAQLDLVKIVPQIIDTKKEAMAKEKEVLILSRNKKTQDALSRYIEHNPELKNDLIKSKAILVDMGEQEEWKRVFAHVKNLSDTDKDPIVLTGNYSEKYLLDSFPEYDNFKKEIDGKNVTYVDILTSPNLAKRLSEDIKSQEKSIKKTTKRKVNLEK